MKYIIDFDNSLSIAEVDQYLADNNITKIKQFGTFGHVFLAESATEITTNDKIVSVVRDHEQGVTLLATEIELVDRSVPSSFGTEELQNWWKVASINSIDFDNTTQTHMVRGINSTVYIVDSGIAIEHPEFVNSNITLLHSFNDNFIDNKGHGTALSSLIVGGTCSLSNPALKVVKVFDTTQPTLQSDLIAALDAIYADYEATGRKASVINMSWAIPKNDYINNKIQRLIDEGIYVVASAGNSGQPIGDVTPASIPDVLTVGSYGQDLTPSKFSDYTEASSISYTANDVNHGALDGWAPGESIYAAGPANTYGYVAGTSVSAAIATAALAYNLDVVLKDDGVVYEDITQFNEDRVNSYTNITMSRSNLLDLSDIKYVGSVNKIATFISKPIKGGALHRKLMKAGTTTASLLFNPIIVKNASCASLPDYVSINDRGVITVNCPEITGLTETLPEIEFTLTDRDNNTDVCVLTLVLWNQSYNTVDELVANNSEEVENNPELNYILQFGPGGCVGAPFYCGEYGCSAYSGGAVSCNAYKAVPGPFACSCN